MKVTYDKATKKWIKEHQNMPTTVCRCSKCGLFYKASLGHKCKKEKTNDKN